MKTRISGNKYTLGERLLAGMYYAYIEGVGRTSRIVKQGEMDEAILSNAIIGFGHGDSFGMQFLLRTFQTEKYHVQAIVTADKRGNYIECVGKKYHIHSLRMPDGFRLRHFLQELKGNVRKADTTLCIALDGPLGPLHEPKKLGFMLANEGEKPMVLIKVDYTKKLTLFKRWDKYAVPLPFGTMTFTAVQVGNITDQQLKDFKEYKEKIKEQLGW